MSIASFSDYAHALSQALCQRYPRFVHYFKEGCCSGVASAAIDPLVNGSLNVWQQRLQSIVEQYKNRDLSLDHESEDFLETIAYFHLSKTSSHSADRELIHLRGAHYVSHVTGTYTGKGIEQLLQRVQEVFSSHFCLRLSTSLHVISVGCFSDQNKGPCWINIDMNGLPFRKSTTTHDAAREIFQSFSMSVDNGLLPLGVEFFVARQEWTVLPNVPDVTSFSQSIENTTSSSILTAWVLNAIRLSEIQQVKQLLEGLSNPNQGTARGVTLLYMAVSQRCLTAVDILLQKGATVDTEGANGISALWLASAHGDCEVVQRLIQAKANVDHKAIQGISVLQIAAEEGHESVVRELIAAGADVNCADNRGTTPLAIATNRKHTAIVELLLKHGAHPLVNR